MIVHFDSNDLERLATDEGYVGRFPQTVIPAYRRLIRLMSSVRDERDIRANPGYRLEKLKGRRSGQHSIRLNDQWRLIIRIEDGAPEKTVYVAEIVDYH